MSILRQDATIPASGGRSSDATPILYRVGAVEVLDRITEVLRSMLAAWVSEQERPRHRMLSVPELVASLDPLRDWVVKHAQAEAWHDRLLEQCLSALEQIDIPPERVFVGTCPSCGVDLWPAMGEDIMVCPNSRCKAQIDVRARRREGLRRIEGYEAPLPRIVDTLRAAGEKITYDQARQWATRKDVRGRVLLRSVGQDQRGSRLYRLGDVRSVMMRKTRRTARAYRNA
ncbi:hypothetical protein KTJ89_11330 [Brevibacterium sediminis]|uniref:hypothetical protein n=1 Tax=Brevibacterium sediminis TaxID=1857024 RepID=UPI00217538C7|nr:hypothetical protein [Brevibacterium sediminis]MCS4593573.1 hypothetical protein [Brevibacterium sediminis]